MFEIAYFPDQPDGRFCSAVGDPWPFPRYFVGTGHARRADMPATARFEDLTVWQRMLELNLEVRKATTRSASGRDLRLADEICHAADSAERNVTEGFGRFDPAECARFLARSRASTLETQTLLQRGLVTGYWSQEEVDRLDALAVRSLEALAAFQRYLPSPRFDTDDGPPLQAQALERSEPERSEPERSERSERFERSERLRL